jgi:hypothetical protein
MPTARTFFSSTFLNKTIYLDELYRLSEEDQALLMPELRNEIESMQARMHKESVSASSDWLYSISIKIKVCEHFLGLLSNHRGFLTQYLFDEVKKRYGSSIASSCLSTAKEKYSQRLLAITRDN